MTDFLIGAGAVLTAGADASIAGATLHAQTDPLLAAQVGAALVDFEASRPEELSRVLILAAGWNPARFEREITAPLLARGDCTLADVLEALAAATGCSEVHLFARWMPGAALACALAKRGVHLVAHPLEAIDRAALVTGGRLSRWRAPFRAA
ncbi:MAG TPA: hypothetical protein VMH02_06585 [Verrucomicrobiae bacterium]|nr:hypothetical protein [Verrucomicrobiae bacterium]